MRNLFDLTGRVAIITGGCGLLGKKHVEAITYAGGIPVIADIVEGIDITKEDIVEKLLADTLSKYGRIDILINNAANNPKVENLNGFIRLENFPLSQWEDDLAVSLTGSFLCSKIIGSEMARRKKGVIVNIGSDLSYIAPDQRLYQKEGLPLDQQPVKPISYSVVKTGIIGLTRYLATYWADSGIRVNTLSPGGVYNSQPEDFVKKFSYKVPMGRMANSDEYQAAIIFLCSDASSYMTGTNLVMDGGKSCW